MAAKLDLPLVATNDCHYVDRADAAAHEVLMAIQTGKSLTDEKRLKHTVDSYYLKSPGEMNDDFMSVPQALENTVAIAKRCKVKLEARQDLPAQVQGPRRRDASTATSVRSPARASSGASGAGGRGRGTFDPTSTASAATELAVIQKMGFSGYFLIVWDFINWAKEHGIPVGPGRGSGAGSRWRGRCASPTSTRWSSSCCSSAS
jgi:DNA polymerase-3 subunit alpha